MRTLICMCGLFLLYSCDGEGTTDFDFLIGTWKIEGEEQYEVWVKGKKNELDGYSYILKKNQKSITETISLRVIDDQIVYEATVPEQNEGKTIQFTLRSDISSYFSFENLNHDFPKKIQYHPKSENEIMIRVLGDEGKGLSYTLIRQEFE